MKTASSGFLRLAAFLLLAVVGYLAGVATVRDADAAISVEVYVNPGTQSTTATLLCGWHSDSGCPYHPTTGKALDWTNGLGHNVVWRSWGIRSDATDVIGWGTIRTAVSASNCNQVRLDVRDLWGFDKGWIRYSHTGTWTPGWDITIHGGPVPNPVSSVYVVGFTLAETAPCPWEGPHLHQTANSYWQDNRFLYPMAPASGGPYPVASFNYHQHSQSWCWFC